MAVDKLVDSSKLNAALDYEASKIIAKGGGTAPLAFDFANEKGFGDYIDAIPSGGGSGATKIADGTYTGAGEYQFVIPVGKKMPQTDFIFNLWADNGTEFLYDSKNQIIVVQFILQKRFGYYDLSTDGDKLSSSSISVIDNNSGAKTTRTYRGNSPTRIDIRYGSVSASLMGNAGGSTNCLVNRSSSGFSLQLNSNSVNIILASGVTYSWELLYIGSDPANDIVEVP